MLRKLHAETVDARGHSGALFLVGGGGTPPNVVDRFLDASGGLDAPILVLPQTMRLPHECPDVELLRACGARQVIHCLAAAPTIEDRAELAAALREVGGIWIPGGVQRRFMRRLGRTWLRAHLVPAVRRGASLYGTSAGAMVCSDPMICGPGRTATQCRMGRGLGLTRWVVDTHFSEREREARLLFAMRAGRSDWGVGLDERAWVVMRSDRVLERHGGVSFYEGLRRIERAA